MASSSMPHHLLLKEKAMDLHTRAALFMVGNNKRPNSELRSLPKSIDGVPWRRIYGAQTGTYATTGLNDVAWSPEELSRGGNGSMWCCTLLPRGGKNGNGNIMRTSHVDGQNWGSRTGRCPRNGFPKSILVDKLRLGCFEMIELTDAEEDKPMVALCKIKKKTTPAQNHVMVPSLNSEVGALSSQQMHDLSNAGSEMMPQMMEVCQLQAVNPEIPAHMPDIQMQIDGCFCSTSFEGETLRGTHHSMAEGTNSIFQVDAFSLDDLSEWVNGCFDEDLNQADAEVELDGNEEGWIVVGYPGGYAD